MPNLEEIQRVAAKVAQHYVRRLPPWVKAHIPDMIQEAVIAQLDASSRFVPTLGTWDAFATRAASWSIRHYLWKHRAVVAPPRGEMRSPAQVLRMEGAVRKQVEAEVSPEPSPAALLDQERLRTRVREALLRLDESKNKIGVEAILTEYTKDGPGQSRSEYNARRVLLKRAKRSPALKALWKETTP